ncbi:MAG: hypothetical protein DGJ47_000718 [Rickettsiaceae bacterium]
MRIIAGKHKNRVIPTIKGASYRPSTAKFREAIFNILSSGAFSDSKPIENGDILDLFAGTGSLSFEALSRGARSATLVDINSEHLKDAVLFAEKIGEKENVTTHSVDASFVRLPQEKFSVVFMDPPYETKYITKTLRNLQKTCCLIKGAIVIIEMSKYEKLNSTPGFELLKEKIYGNNKLLVLKYGQKEE